MTTKKSKFVHLRPQLGGHDGAPSRTTILINSELVSEVRANANSTCYIFFNFLDCENEQEKIHLAMSYEKVCEILQAVG